MAARSSPAQTTRDKTRLTPAEYLGLRRSEPGFSRLMEQVDRIDEIEKHDEKLRQRNVDVDLLFEVLRSSPIDPDTMDFGSSSRDQLADEISEQLIAAIDADTTLKKSHSHANARSGATLPDSLINEVILALLEQYTDIPASLMSLLQMRLSPKLATPSPAPNMDEKKAKALVVLARNPTISTHALARAANINQSTASRWMSDAQFMRAAQLLNVRR